MKVRVAPGASRDGILGAYGDALKVAVREPPEKGRANEAVARALAAALGVRAKDVEILRGRASRDKVVLVRGLGEAELRARLGGIV